MKASQYIYTSWKNGDSPDKGFMIYAKSADLSDAECEEIKYAMQYVVPRDLNPMPDEQEIADTFPYSFSYFTLTSGRRCVAHTTYLGRDYSSRFGNYLIYALIFEDDELDIFPSELFSEEYMKTAMTEEELSAQPPIPPLEKLEIEDWGNIVNDELLIEFVSEHEEEFAYFLSAVIESRERRVPFYLNDTRENLVMWFAALHRAFPLPIAKQITFNTYLGDYQKFQKDVGKMKYTCYGVRSGDFGLDYGMASQSAANVVLDFIGGNMTPGIPILDMARALACSYTLGMDDIFAFGDFLLENGIRSFDKSLEGAYHAFCLNAGSELNGSNEVVAGLCSFIEACDNPSLAATLASNLVHRYADLEAPTLQTLSVLIPTLYRHADFMMYSIHDILFNLLWARGTMGTADHEALSSLLAALREKNPTAYADFLNYAASEDSVSQALMEVESLDDPKVLHYFLRFILQNYSLAPGLSPTIPINRLLRKLLEKLAQSEEGARLVLSLLESLKDNTALLNGIIIGFLYYYPENKTEGLCPALSSVLHTLPDPVGREVLHNILKFPNTSRFAPHLNALYIKESTSPESAFWDLYRTQFEDKSTLMEIDLSKMIDAMLISEDASVTRLLTQIPTSHFGTRSTAETIIARIEALSVKTLLTERQDTFARLLALAQKHSLTSRLQKVSAIIFLRSLDAPQKLSETGLKSDIHTSDFNKKDYNDYLDEAFPKLMRLTTDAEDFKIVCRLMYNGSYFDEFCDRLIDKLKKAEKHDKETWLRLNGLIAAYLIDCGDRVSEASALQKDYVKYFRKLDEDEMEKVRNASNKPNSNFFEKALEKESLSSKLGGFFRRK